MKQPLSGFPCACVLDVLGLAGDSNRAAGPGPPCHLPEVLQRSKIQAVCSGLLLLSTSSTLVASGSEEQRPSGSHLG